MRRLKSNRTVWLVSGTLALALGGAACADSGGDHDGGPVEDAEGSDVPKDTQAPEFRAAEQAFEAEGVELSVEEFPELAGPDSGAALEANVGRLAHTARTIETDAGPVEVEEVVLFDDEEQSEALFRRDERKVVVADMARPTASFVPRAPAGLGFAAGGSGGQSSAPATGGTSFTVSTGGTTAAPADSDLGFTGTPTVQRFVANDEMPLFPAASFDTEPLTHLDRGETVIVLPDAPQVAGGAIFVRVRNVDTAPYRVGFMPLQWLYVKPTHAKSGELTFEATYGLAARSLSQMVENVFYEGCDYYPRYPHNDWGLLPEEQQPSPLPADARYRCGEYPIGDTYSKERKRLTTVDFTTPGFEHDGTLFKVFIDPIPLSVPIDMYRLDSQTRDETYTMRDLGTSFPLSQWGADLVERRAYSVFPNAGSPAVHEKEDLVRIHDTDFWFNVSFEPPNGVKHQGADAYFNTCFVLPGSRVRAATFPTNIELVTKSAKTRKSKIEAISFGAVDFSSFKVCATAAITEVDATNGSGTPQNTLVSNQTRALSVKFVRATIHDLELDYVEGVKLFGDFDNLHGALVGTALDHLNHILKNGIHFSIAGKELVNFDGVGSLLYNAMLEGALKDRTVDALADLEQRLSDRLPDPERLLRTACDRLMPVAYADVSSPYYPLYQQCKEAARHVEVDLISNAEASGGKACHDPSAFARVNEGKAWSETKTTHRFDLAEPTPDAPEAYLVLKRPHWVTQCDVESTATTTVMNEWWPLLTCMRDVTNRDVNFGQEANLSSHLQTECLKPAVKMLCDLYGEGDDLKEMWAAQAGIEPPSDSPFWFCAYYQQLDKKPCDLDCFESE